MVRLKGALAPWFITRGSAAFAKLWSVKLLAAAVKRPEHGMLSVAVLALEYFRDV